MALMNAKISQTIWYGFAAVSGFLVLQAYKPKYPYCFANVKRI
jgi:hypothetical protein